MCCREHRFALPSQKAYGRGGILEAAWFCMCRTSLCRAPLPGPRPLSMQQRCRAQHSMVNPVPERAPCRGPVASFFLPHRQPEVRDRQQPLALPAAEIWALLDLMAPDCLGSRREFSDGIALPIMRGQKYTATELDMQLVRCRLLCWCPLCVCDMLARYSVNELGMQLMRRLVCFWRHWKHLWVSVGWEATAAACGIALRALAPCQLVQV